MYMIGLFAKIKINRVEKYCHETNINGNMYFIFGMHKRKMVLIYLILSYFLFNDNIVYDILLTIVFCYAVFYLIFRLSFSNSIMFTKYYKCQSYAS